MLASSTMAQMGFMMVQCGLGLFPAAVAHLCWHGMYKAFLFLNSGGAARDKRLGRHDPPGLLALVLALACGAAGSYGFAAASGKPWLPTDTTLVLVAVAFVAGAQFALALMRRRPLARLPLALPLTGVMGLIYGGSVRLMEAVLAPDGLARPLPLNALHVAAIVLLLVAWLAMLYVRREPGKERVSGRGLALYVKTLNASQPHPSTVTAQRNHYNPA
jgi:NAD(P)H-quinone oxidoreductase subunit 5